MMGRQTNQKTASGACFLLPSGVVFYCINMNLTVAQRYPFTQRYPFAQRYPFTQRHPFTQRYSLRTW